MCVLSVCDCVYQYIQVEICINLYVVNIVNVYSNVCGFVQEHGKLSCVS